MKKTVAFILSSGHSGSTLLGAFFHAHSQVMHIGEIVTPMVRMNKQDYAYRCLYCGENPCPIWHDLLSEEFVQYCYQGYRLNRKGHKKKSWRKYRYKVAAYWRTLRGTAGKPGELFNYLFEHVPDVDVIVDSSKQIQWARWNSHNPTYRTVYIFLMRDLRALIASGLRRKYGTLEVLAEKEASKRRELLAFHDSLPAQHRITVQYEELTKHPAQIGQQLCEFFGLDYQPGMLKFYQVKNHIWGGNPSIVAQALRFHSSDPAQALKFVPDTNRQYYQQNLILGFRQDSRWNAEFTDAMLKEIAPIIGAANRSSGYDT